MTWLEFISAVVTALAWPTAAVVMLTLIRKPLTDLVPYVERLKYKGIELEFGKRLAEIREGAVVEEAFPTATGPTTLDPIFEELARISPRAAVTEAWRWVEIAGLDTAKVILGEDFKKTKFTRGVIRKLERAQKLDSGVGALIGDLKGLRNEAVHAPEFAIGSDQAIDYAKLALEAAEYLRTVEGDSANSTGE